MPTTSKVNGLSGLAPLQKIGIANPEATPEERYGGPVNPYHASWGEKARPYPWESSLDPSGSHGPYGLENQMLGDEFWFIEPGGMPSDDPAFDYEMPSITRSHGAPHTAPLSGKAPSQYEAICTQLEQSAEMHGAGTNASTGMATWDSPLQDHWYEIWNVSPGHTDIPKAPGAIGNNAFGFGVNDRPMNTYAKINEFGFESAHIHRRYAMNSIPGNYMWLRPGGRPMVKSLAGPARPAIGNDSPFFGDDLGMAFDYHGAILQTTPPEYVPPPQPFLAPSIDAQYGNAFGTDGVELY